MPSYHHAHIHNTCRTHTVDTQLTHTAHRTLAVHTHAQRVQERATAPTRPATRTIGSSDRLPSFAPLLTSQPFLLLSSYYNDICKLPGVNEGGRNLPTAVQSCRPPNQDFQRPAAPNRRLDTHRLYKRTTEVLSVCNVPVVCERETNRVVQALEGAVGRIR